MLIFAERSTSRFAATALAAFFLLSAALFAQETPRSPAISAQVRLTAARRIFIEHAGGRLPNDVIGDAFQGWGRYNVVGDPADADLIVSINAPTADSGVSVGGADGRQGASNRTLSSSTVTQIRLLILDAHDRVTLWSGTEQPRSAMKEKQREDNVVEASLRLFRRFRNVIEPEPAP